MTREDIQLLFEYDRWANNRVLQAATALTAEAFTRDLGGSFCSVRETRLMNACQSECGDHRLHERDYVSVHW
jgi:uncharacterized damage-inducible protein DinB